MNDRFKVFIIDDESDIIEVIKAILSEEYSISGATNSKDGIKQLKEGHYDLLILDYYIDELNGREVVAEIRKFNDKIPIVLLTGNKDRELSSSMLDSLNIQGYFEKSADFEGIVKSVVKLAEHIRKSGENEDSFATRLKELRKFYKVSQEELAQYLGVKRNTVSYYESGLSEPSHDVLKKIADYFSVSVDYLLAYVPNRGNSIIST